MQKAVSPTRAFNRVLPAAVAVIAGGLALGVGASSAAGASVAETVRVSQPASMQRADSWTFGGWYPDPLVCHLSGIASGVPYSCNFIFVGWTLWFRDA